MMNEPSFILLTGFAGIGGGIVMALFAEPIGKGFCRVGKWTFKDAPASLSQETIDRIYDESRAPAIFRLMGVLNIVIAIFVTAIRLVIASNLLKN